MLQGKILKGAHHLNKKLQQLSNVSWRILFSKWRIFPMTNEHRVTQEQKLGARGHQALLARAQPHELKFSKIQK